MEQQTSNTEKLPQSNYEIWIKKIALVMGHIDSMANGTTKFSSKRLGILNVQLSEVVEQMRVEMALEKNK